MRFGSKREYINLVLSRGQEIAADESAVVIKSLKAVALETLGTGIIVGFCFFFLSLKQLSESWREHTLSNLPLRPLGSGALFCLILERHLAISLSGN